MAGEILAGDTRKLYCINCNAEKGMTVVLVEDSRSGEFVCQANPKHRYKMTKSGYLEAVPERR